MTAWPSGLRCRHCHGWHCQCIGFKFHTEEFRVFALCYFYSLRTTFTLCYFYGLYTILSSSQHCNSAGPTKLSLPCGVHGTQGKRLFAGLFDGTSLRELNVVCKPKKRTKRSSNSRHGAASHASAGSLDHLVLRPLSFLRNFVKS